MASTTTAQEIIDDAEAILQDTGNVRWSAAEHLTSVNNGTKEICLIKSDAYIVTTSFILVAGTLQSLPTAGFQLMEITHNMGTDGSTVGTPIRLVERTVLDAMNPSWRTATADATVEYYMYDERVPLQFHVSPPQPAANQGYVQAFYSAAPAEIAADASILLADIYRSVLLDYVLYRAYSKDADYAPNAQRAIAHYQAFLNALGVRKDSETLEDPNTE